jgi:predicted lipoprotein
MRLSQIAERIEFLDPEMKSASNRIDILETVSHGNAIRIQQLIAALLMTDDDKGQGNRATSEFLLSGCSSHICILQNRLLLRIPGH